MPKISHYESLIQEKRKKTPFRDFVKELGSWEVMNLYKRDGRVCRYPESPRVKRLDDAEFQNASSHFLEYDFSHSFFENFQSFHDIFPFQHLMQFMKVENSEYADALFWAKNTYLSFVIWIDAENIAYSALCYGNIHNIYNSFLACNNSSNIYSSAGVDTSHNIFYSRFILNSSNAWFSSNLIGCEECIGCDKLENKRYHIGNQAYSKEEYLKKKQRILSDKKGFDTYYNYILDKKAVNFASTNVNGEYIIKSSNIENGGWIINFHDSRNVLAGNGQNWSKNIYDGIDVGLNGSDFYGAMAAGGDGCSNIYCSMQIWSCSHIYYGYFLENCHHCLGCIGLKNQSYCILNKQYTKEEWEVLADEIFASMEVDGTLGEFFPGSLNPFYFNDTLAYMIDESFTKEEVEKDGYLWRDEPIRADIPEHMEVIRSTELDPYQGFDTEWNWNIDVSILDRVIIDIKGNSYRIVKMEYDFLLRHGLPLPTLHWLDRIKMGFR